MAELVLIYDSVTGGFISKQAGADHIANAAITSAKVASGAIAWPHLAAGGILSANIASGAIGSSHLSYSPGAGGLLSGDHAALLHLSGQIGSGQIGWRHLADQSIGSNVIVAQIIGGPHLVLGDIRSGHIGSGQLGTFHFIDGAIVSSKVAAGILATPHIQNQGILSASYGAAVIAAPHIAAGGLLSGNIGSGQISIDHMPEKPWDRLTVAISPRYVIPGWLIDTGAVGSFASGGTLFYTPIFVPRTFTYIGINTQVTTGASGQNGRLGIYQWNGGVPGSLILDAGTFNASGIGNKSINISQLLGPGYYFLALAIAQVSTIGYRTADNARAVGAPVGGVEDTAGNAPFAAALAKTAVPGYVGSGLPNPADAPDAAAQIGTFPLVWLQEA